MQLITAQPEERPYWLPGDQLQDKTTRQRRGNHSFSALCIVFKYKLQHGGVFFSTPFLIKSHDSNCSMIPVSVKKSLQCVFAHGVSKAQQKSVFSVTSLGTKHSLDSFGETVLSVSEVISWCITAGFFQHFPEVLFWFRLLLLILSRWSYTASVIFGSALRILSSCSPCRKSGFLAAILPQRPFLIEPLWAAEGSTGPCWTSSALSWKKLLRSFKSDSFLFLGPSDPSWSLTSPESSNFFGRPRPTNQNWSSRLLAD